MKPRLAVLLLALLSFAAPVGCSYDVVIDSDGDTVPDNADLCPDDPELSEDEGACGCNYRKIKDRCVYLESVEDSDKDGTPDIFKDSDEDGTPDLYDHCPNDPNKIEPGTCGCGTPDTDTDGDTTPDCIDKCPNDPNKTESGYCGCGKDDLDENGDTIIDCADDCPDDPNKLDPGICGCGTPDTDSDGDSTPDCIDQCPDDPNKTEEGHCGCGVSDTDSKGTPKIDCDDECPDDPNKTEPGFCGCGTPDDANNNNIPDCNETCIHSTVNKTTAGICGCDTRDDDYDSDGTPDCIDECPKHSIKIKPGICGCDTPDTDTDGDGTPDCIDKCPNDPLNTDSDDDGTPDCIDKCPTDPTKQHCPCDLSGLNAEVEITEDGETKRIPVCMEEGGVLQVGYTKKPFEANSYETMMNAYNNRSISHQNIRLHYSPAGNLLINPALEHNDKDWTIDGKSFIKDYGNSHTEGCKCQSQSINCLCRAFGKYPALRTTYGSFTNFKQTIMLSNSQCKDDKKCTLPLTVGMFAFALANINPPTNDPNDTVQIKFNGNTLDEFRTVPPTETKFFTLTGQVQLSQTSQKVDVTFSGKDGGNWSGHYGAVLHYFAAWLGEREIRFSNDGLTWTPWQTFAPAEKGSSDAWFVEWDIGKCDADETSCIKTVYMQTHDLLTDRYYETSDSVQYIPEN